MDQGLVQIVLAIIGLLGTLITAIAVPLIKAKYDAEKRAKIYDYIKIAVGAADQILKVEDPTGEKRKQFVVDYLTEKGLKITMEDLNMMIEAAVQQLNIIQQQAMVGTVTITTAQP